MSAYLVEDITINRIVSYIENENHFQYLIGELNTDYLEAEKLGLARCKNANIKKFKLFSISIL